MPPLFQFCLKPLPDLLKDWEAAQLDIPNYLSGWFWLSYGWYWIQTPDGDLPLNHCDFNKDSALPDDFEPHLDYQVARLLMDLEEIMPAVLEPLPEPFAGWVASGAWQDWRRHIQSFTSGENEPAWEVFAEAQLWWSRRHLDMGYLSAPPEIRFWRVGDTISMDWDTRDKRVQGVLCWVESHGRMEISVEQWLSEWSQFQHRIELAMRQCLSEVEALGLLGTDKLASLWAQHDKYFNDDLMGENTDWDAVYSAIVTLEEWSGLRLPRF